MRRATFRSCELAKELGYTYKGNVEYYYSKIDNKVFRINFNDNIDLLLSNNDNNNILAPMQSDLQKWIRNNFNLHISIYPIGDHWEWDVRDCDLNNKVHISISSSDEGTYGKKYEDALEFGLLSVLNKLKDEDIK